MPPVKINYTRPPNLVDYQTEMIDCPERYAVIEASTKSGKTTSMIVWLFEEALKAKRNQSVFWIAPVFLQARIAFDRMQDYISDKKFFTVNEARLSITLAHGAIISFKGSDNPDTLYGDDCYAAVIDEASRVKEDSWHAIRTTLTKTGGKCKLIGNVKGRHNFFYLLAQKAKKGEADFYYKKITAYDAVKAGILSLAEVEDSKALLPDNVFKRDYLAEPSDDGGNPFGLQFIQQCAYPMSSAEPVCFGIDLAKSIDFTVIIGLDKNGCVCYFDRAQCPYEETIRKINNLKQAPCMIDSTGVGAAVVEKVQMTRHTVTGFHFSQTSKQEIMGGLAVGIQQRKLSFPDYSTTKLHYGDPGNIKIELESFEYEYTQTGVRYSAPSGLHDDCVCALALAYHQFKNLGSGTVNWA